MSLDHKTVHAEKPKLAIAPSEKKDATLNVKKLKQNDIIKKRYWRIKIPMLGHGQN
jgi:hypothetical protein